MKLTNPFTRFREEEATELPFFIFLTLVMVGIYVLAVVGSAPLHNPLVLAVFTVLMVAHTFLYWLAPSAVKNLRQTLVYLVGQGALAFILTMLGRHLGLAMGLFMGLIGITAGLLKLSRLGIAFISFFLALSLVSYGLVQGWGQVPVWVVGTLPASAFVIIYVVLYNRQGEARARAQALLAELESANRQLAEYAERVEELTLANERQRMARELHDTLSQGLAGLILQLEAADAHLANTRPDRARAIVQQTMERARATLADARRAIQDLRQAPDSPRDVLAPLRLEVDRFTDATGIPCELVVAWPGPIPEVLDEPVLRTVAEGLTNIARHAQASRVQLRLASVNGCLEVELRDNGVGFDPRSAASQAGHYGLLGMQERARLAGGTLAIASQPGAGTTITLRLPLSSAVEKEVATEITEDSEVKNKT